MQEFQWGMIQFASIKKNGVQISVARCDYFQLNRWIFSFLELRDVYFWHFWKSLKIANSFWAYFYQSSSDLPIKGLITFSSSFQNPIRRKRRRRKSWARSKSKENSSGGAQKTKTSHQQDFYLSSWAHYFYLLSIGGGAWSVGALETWQSRRVR